MLKTGPMDQLHPQAYSAHSYIGSNSGELLHRHSSCMNLPDLTTNILRILPVHRIVRAHSLYPLITREMMLLLRAALCEVLSKRKVTLTRRPRFRLNRAPASCSNGRSGNTACCRSRPSRSFDCRSRRNQSTRRRCCRCARLRPANLAKRNASLSSQLSFCISGSDDRMHNSPFEPPSTLTIRFSLSYV